MNQRCLEKAGALCDLLQSESQERCEDAGGYPGFAEIIGNHVVLAEDDHENGIHLKWWILATAASWYDAVQEILAEADEDPPDIADALWSTEPTPAGERSH